MDDMNRIVICKHCGRPEYYGEMRWLSGFCGCRNCYKARWQDENHKQYTWNDLDGKRPTIEEYNEQEDVRVCPICNKGVSRRFMHYTKDCHGITFRLVCESCYPAAMAKGYDGEFYTEADEHIDSDY